MATRGSMRLPVGSAAWIAEERDSALSIAQSEIEEFAFSARNEIDWLNEHMAEIFSENQMNVTELFKTPGRLRGKTPRTARKTEPGSVRVPLSNVFSSTPKGAPNPFAMSTLSQARSPKIWVAEDKPEPSVARVESPVKPAVVHPPHQVEARAPVSLADSGYHGSQPDMMSFDDQFDKDIEMSDGPLPNSDAALPLSSEADPVGLTRPSTASSENPFRSTNEDQTRYGTSGGATNIAPTPSSAILQPSSPFATRTRLPIMSPRSPSPKKMASPVKHSPQKSSPQKSSSPKKSSSSPQQLAPSSPQKKDITENTESPKDESDPRGHESDDAAEVDGARSPSDASSPIRPIVRKSSLNFASLPAREPLASKKSLGGARMSRTSHLDFNRQSYYSRHTGGKSLGGAMRAEPDEDDQDEMDVDDEVTIQQGDVDSKAAAHGKTYTQLLQDQISLLGKAPTNGARPSKSLANLMPPQQAASKRDSQQMLGSAAVAKPPSPKQKQSVPAPGAFPEDDDDWISPPDTAKVATSAKPKPSDARQSDSLEKVKANEVERSPELVLAKSRPASPGKAPSMQGRTPKHGKSASVPILPIIGQPDSEPDDIALKKTISVSNPTLSTVPEDELSSSPPKSPSRGFRENPLKQVKNKLSSLLKGSKGLIASSAAISAEGKSSLLQSPSTTKLGYHPEASVESFKTADNVIYPDLSQQVSATSAPLSPVRSNSSRRTRASTEREKQEAKDREREEKEREREKEKEMKEAKRLAEQMEKLEKAREKEREKARVFSKEQEKIAAMEKQVAAQREQDKTAPQQQAQDLRTPAPPPHKTSKSVPTKAVKATPIKSRAQAEQDGKSTAATSDEPDQEMRDNTTTTIPQSIPRPTTASSVRTQGIKRPTRPGNETLAKSKQAPTLIRVNTTSSQQSQFHPSNSTLGGTLHYTLSQPPGPAKPLNGKASQNSLSEKPSLRSLNSSVPPPGGRPKALDKAAKQKEQEELQAQRRRETKLENERKRAAQEEERKQQEQRRLDAERQKEEERKAAQARKAAIEKAKQTKAPPPAVRSQPNGPPEYGLADKAPMRPPSRLGSTMHQESRLVNTVLSNTAKGPSKRPLQQDAAEESSRAQQQRTLPSLAAKEAKRMRMSEEFDEDIDMVESHSQRIIKGPPVRPSAGFKKELPLPSKPTMYANGYSNAPAPSASRDLFKATVTAQHNSHVKAAHPLDMAQLSKGAIPFAPSNPHKTPARPAGAGAAPKSAKSAARSSPRFQNGETIELPDIQTDDESDEDDGHVGTIAAWADSPALKAALLAQERVDPMQVFGPPAPLNMEEVFSKTKDRWHKFRARTSSANWSGTDRLTEDDIRKDLAARDKMRREGGWSYELGRDMT